MKVKKVKVKCECGEGHQLLVEKDIDGIYYFSVEGDCRSVLVYEENLEKLRRFLKK